MINNKMAIAIYLSIIILNENGLNASIKGHRVAEWMRTRPTVAGWLS